MQHAGVERLNLGETYQSYPLVFGKSDQDVPTYLPLADITAGREIGAYIILS